MSVLDTFGINGKLFFAQIVNFSIVLFVMWKWVYIPVLKMMDKRSALIQKGLEDAEEAKHRLSEAATSKERLIGEARTEAQDLMAKAKVKADAVHADKLHKAKEDAARVMADAEIRINTERDAAADALRKDLASLVTDASRKVYEGFDEKAHRELITDAIKDMERASSV